MPHIDDFDIGAKIGEGAFGECVYARELDGGREVAIKMVSIPFVVKHNKMVQVSRERNILAAASHPTIVSLYSAFKDSEYLYFVFEYCPNGSLSEWLRQTGPFHLAAVQFYMAELLIAIDYLHKQKIVHRDIKPDNLMLDRNMRLRLIDFGSAKQIDENNKLGATFTGTAEYLAPEALGEDQPALFAADMWAVGVVVYQLLAGHPPFRGEMHLETFEKISKVDLTYPKDFPDVAKDLVSKLLVKDPGQRLGSGRKGMKELYTHPFFADINFKKLAKATPPPINSEMDKFIPPGVLSEDVVMVGKRKGKAPAPIASSSRSIATTGIDDAHKFKFLQAGESIVLKGLVRKTKPLAVPRKRLLILTSLPRMVYCKPDTLEVRGEIPFTKDVDLHCKDDKNFIVIVPSRVYNFEVLENDRKAVQWQTAVNKAKEGLGKK